MSMSAQTKVNLSVKAVYVGASVYDAELPVSLINANRTSASKYWSSYHGDEFFGQYEYVELRWEENNDFL